MRITTHQIGFSLALLAALASVATAQASAPPGAWVAAVAGSKKTWDERPSNIHIDVDGNLASAWMDYTFRLNGAISQWGIDSFDFVKSKGEWKINQLGD